MSYLTERQLAARNEGYNPNRAGENMLKACNQARRYLIDKLVKPSKPFNESDYEKWVTEVNNIQSMDYNELMKEVTKVNNDNR